MLVLVSALEESAFDLISVHRPFRLRLFGSAIEFEVWRRTHFFDKFSKIEWFATVVSSRCDVSASNRSVVECQSATNSEQEVFMRDSPVVSHTELGFDPN